MGQKVNFQGMAVAYAATRRVALREDESAASTCRGAVVNK
jgi:hypothetical protein